MVNVSVIDAYVSYLGVSSSDIMIAAMLNDRTESLILSSAPMIMLDELCWVFPGGRHKYMGLLVV